MRTDRRRHRRRRQHRALTVAAVLAVVRPIARSLRVPGTIPIRRRGDAIREDDASRRVASRR